MPIKIQFTTFAISAALAFASGAQAAPAPAPTPDGVKISVRVSVADLDLHQKAGEAVAHRRIQQAAAYVCGDEPTAANLGRYSLYRSCVRAAVDSAVIDLNTQMAALPEPRSAPGGTALAANR